MSGVEQLACKIHPDQSRLEMVDMRTYSNERFICQKCYFQWNQNKGLTVSDYYMPLEKIIEDPVIAVKKYNQNCDFSQFMNQFDTLMKTDIEDVSLLLKQLIEQTKDSIVDIIGQITKSLESNIIVLNKLKENIRAVKQQFYDQINHQELRETYEQIKEQPDKCNIQQLINLKQSLEHIIHQVFYVEFTADYSQIKQKYNEIHLPNQYESFYTDIDNEVNKLKQQIREIIENKQLSQLCQWNFQTSIQQKIKLQFQRFKPIYYLHQQDNKDIKKLKEILTGLSKTLFFMKLDNGQIIGAYASQKWISESRPNDQHASSFLFSVTTNSFYPLQSDSNFTDLNHPRQIFSFGDEFIFNADCTIMAPEIMLQNKKSAKVVQLEVYHHDKL